MFIIQVQLLIDISMCSEARQIARVEDVPVAVTGLGNIITQILEPLIMAMPKACHVRI